MALTPGTKLGPYEIVAPLGAGGMGEVYRARDPRLGRDVAIKVLPEHLSAQEEVRARFEREARTVSSLNHPHICTLFDVGREGETDYLVMELIEGETLAQRLVRGALPLAETLRLGAQIADALERAHRAGVIHRDLKPGNVMLTKVGSGPVNAKLMDFGLARAIGLAGASGSGATAITMAALTRTPTVAQPLTAEGTLVGTYQYMSPEQLEGREADARSDLWAFGCVLYEMVTGKRAFEAKSQASLIAAILEREPAPIATLAPMTPPGLDRTVRQCLAKDPDERWQTAADLRRDLLWIMEGGSQSGAPVSMMTPASSAGAAAAPMAAQRPARDRRPWIALALAAIGVAAVVTLVPRLFHRAPPPRVGRFTILPPGNLSTENALSGNAVISPDGRRLVMAAGDSTGRTHLFVRPLDAIAPRELPGTEGGYYPFWSPDSRSIGFFSEGKLKRINLDGGRPQTLCDASAGRGATWNRDGVILFSPTSQSPLFRVSASGGEATPLTSLDAGRKEIAHRWPQFLPDGRHFLFMSLPARDGQYETFIGSLDGKPARSVARSEAAAVYAPPGYLVLERNGTLLAQEFDAARGVSRGEPVALVDPPSSGGNLGEPSVSVSNDGTMSYVNSAVAITRLVWLDRGGRQVGVVPVAPAAWFGLVPSPDWTKAALALSDPATAVDIWMLQIDRGSVTRFTSEPALEWYYPTWSPDGRRLAFASNRSGPYHIYVRPVTGTGQEELLSHSEVLKKWPTSWSPDGRWIIFESSGPETGDDLWLLPMDGDRKPTPFLESRFNERGGQISPDGRWVAYVTDTSGRNEICVQPFPAPGAVIQVSTDGGDSPGWSRDGHELFFRSPGGNLMSVAIETTPTLHATVPRPLFRIPTGMLDLTFDGQRGLGLAPVSAGDRTNVTLVLNWADALQTP